MPNRPPAPTSRIAPSALAAVCLGGALITAFLGHQGESASLDDPPISSAPPSQVDVSLIGVRADRDAYVATVRVLNGRDSAITLTAGRADEGDIVLHSLGGGLCTLAGPVSGSRSPIEPLRSQDLTFRFPKSQCFEPLGIGALVRLGGSIDVGEGAQRQALAFHLGAIALTAPKAPG